MTDTAPLFGLSGALLVSIGLYGMLTRPALLRKILGFNVAGSGIFLLLGSIAGRGSGPGADPVPQAMVITGIVVALSTTALALGLAWRHRRETGRTTLPDESED